MTKNKQYDHIDDMMIDFIKDGKTSISFIFKWFTPKRIFFYIGRKFKKLWLNIFPKKN